jgi:hypothetical protein
LGSQLNHLTAKHIFSMNQTETLRLNPQLKTLFKDAESRHLNDDEFDLYLSIYPEGGARVAAAREIKAIDGQIVKKVITRIYEIYPFEQKHQLAVAKCIRDVRYVTAYATSCMLMGDPDWYRDKLLLWMKTIIQSFGYPDIPAGSTGRYFKDEEILAHIATLRPNQRSIYETYRGLLEEMRANLSPDAFLEIEPYLNLSLDILAHD